MCLCKVIVWQHGLYSTMSAWHWSNKTCGMHNGCIIGISFCLTLFPITFVKQKMKTPVCTSLRETGCRSWFTSFSWLNFVWHWKFLKVLGDVQPSRNELIKWIGPITVFLIITLLHMNVLYYTLLIVWLE